MGKLIIDGNKVYTVDEACLKRKNMVLPESRMKDTADAKRRMHEHDSKRTR